MPKTSLSRLLLLPALAALALCAPAQGQAAAGASAPDAPAKKRAPLFQITVPPAITLEPPFTGRLTIYLKRDGAKVPAELGAGDGPFFDDPQPMFSMAVKDLKPGDELKFVDEVWSQFPLKDIPNGKYQAQAVLDREHSHSSWRWEEMNLNSPYKYFEIKELRPGQAPPFVRFEMIETSPTPVGIPPGVDKVVIESPILTSFFGTPVSLRCGVVAPVGFVATKRYPAVYQVHAFPATSEFGGDWRAAAYEGQLRLPAKPGRKAARETHPLWNGAFYIFLDAQGPYGHNLLADSDNNGPVAKALVEELIPYLEKKYPLIARPEARILRGQSSGGWSAIWLALTHPETFGAAWATSPDPVDFRAFQATNLYEADSMYVGKDGKDTPSYRVGDQVRLTVRAENAMERVLGPDGDSAQQWCSWQAVFGPKSEKTGLPTPLYDLVSGKIDKSVVERFKKYDIGALLRSDPAKYGPIFRDRVRVIAGDKDNFYLNNAVEMLRAELEKDKMLGTKGGAAGGYIEIRPGANHGVISTPEATNALWSEIEAYLHEKGLFPG